MINQAGIKLLVFPKYEKFRFPRKILKCMSNIYCYASNFYLIHKELYLSISFAMKTRFKSEINLAFE